MDVTQYVIERLKVNPSVSKEFTDILEREHGLSATPEPKPEWRFDGNKYGERLDEFVTLKVMLEMNADTSCAFFDILSKQMVEILTRLMERARIEKDAQLTTEVTR